jgi:hypothetical protein
VVAEPLAAADAAQESKTGRMLMAKCRSLQEENAEMGRELQEGDKHQGEVGGWWGWGWVAVQGEVGGAAAGTTASMFLWRGLLCTWLV